MRIVLDTNVLIAALLNPGRTPDQAIRALLQRRDVVLYDTRILAEYRDVLGREKFRKIDRASIDTLLDELLASGQSVAVTEAYQGEMIDEDDRVFVEVALSGNAEVLLTGNVRHFPRLESVRVLTPGDFLRG